MRSLARGLQILSLFRPERPSLSVEEISQELDLPKSSVYRLVATLRDSGYLRKLPGADGYTLHLQFLRFGEVVRASAELEQAARPHLVRLTQAAGETALLVIRNGDRGMVVEITESPEPMRVIPSIGWSFPLHCGASGKLLLAELPEAERERYLDRPLEKMTERTIAMRDPLRRELARIRSRGYATCDGECMIGVRTAAAPVRDSRGTAIAAVAIAGPAARLDPARQREALSLILTTADAISAEIGGAAELTPLALG